MLFFTPLRAISWLTAQIFQVAKLADALFGLADKLRRQPGPHGQLSIVEVISETTHCLCSSLIQRSGSIHGIPYGYPALLALAQYFVEVGFDDTWQVSAHNLARSCISRVISIVSALLLEYTMRDRTQILIFELAWTKSECVISALVKILFDRFHLCSYLLYWNRASRQERKGL